MARTVLSAWDYVIFSLTLIIPVSFGIYYLWRRKKTTTEEYLLGSRNMPWLPIALSMTTSFMSAIIVLGTPSEVYYYGTMYWWTGVTYILMCLITATVYIPVFYNLNLTSCYEYLELRFNKIVQIMGTVSYLLQTLLYLGLVTYLPSLALNQVTNLSLWGSLLGTGFACILYSTLGGIKGIVGADCFQLGIMLVCLMTIVIKGTIDANGIGMLWKDVAASGNIVYYDFSMDPRVRHTVWSLLIGGTMTWVSNYGIGQSQVQRYLACRSEREAKYAVALNCVFLNIILGFVMITGIICASHFKGCDPLLTKAITKPDQMVPLMVIQKMSSLPGFTGLIISAAYCGTLSSVSTGIHSMSCVVIQDFIKPAYPTISDYQMGGLSRIFTLMFGILSILLAFAASKLSFILQAALSVWGVVGGPLVGVFTLGVFLPFVNSYGAIIGQISGFLVALWIAVGAQLHKQVHPYLNRLKTTTDQCLFVSDNISNAVSDTINNFTFTTPVVDVHENEGLELYKVSYLYYSVIAAFTTIIVGIIVSAFTGFATTSPRLLCPLARWLYCKAKAPTKNEKTMEELPLSAYKC